MTVLQRLQQHYSVRAYTDQAIDRAVLMDILEGAALSQSGSNIQPWRVHVVEGAVIKSLQMEIAKSFPENPLGEKDHIPVYPTKTTGGMRDRRIACGERLYQTLGIAREDKPARYMQAMKNFDFFGAPTGILISARKGISPIQYLDCGIFLQSLQLLAEEKGLGACAQAFWAMWPQTTGRVLGLDEDEQVIVGLSLGYEDKEAAVNSVRQPRQHWRDFTQFHGTDS